MRITALAGLFACIAIFAASSSTVSAITPDLINTNNPEQINQETTVLTFLEDSQDKDTETQPIVVPPKPTVYEIKAKETLTTIAEQHQTTWKRVYDKNETIANPDIIKPGDKIVIPLPDEVVKERPLPEAVVAPVVENTEAKPVKQRQPSSPTSTYSGGSATAAGNRYSPGYCTWYAKNMRSDLPNNLGNANTWVSRAAAQGYATGSAPRPGAIGQQGMHVVYVQAVNSDGTVLISEMNYQGRNVVSNRTVPASTFMYIY